jgi:hypothetical protein
VTRYRMSYLSYGGSFTLNVYVYLLEVIAVPASSHTAFASTSQTAATRCILRMRSINIGNTDLYGRNSKERHFHREFLSLFDR